MMEANQRAKTRRLEDSRRRQERKRRLGELAAADRRGDDHDDHDDAGSAQDENDDGTESTAVEVTRQSRDDLRRLLHMAARRAHRRQHPNTAESAAESVAENFVFINYELDAVRHLKAREGEA
jgi:hypothetical protein